VLKACVCGGEKGFARGTLLGMMNTLSYKVCIDCKLMYFLPHIKNETTDYPEREKAPSPPGEG